MLKEDKTKEYEVIQPQEMLSKLEKLFKEEEILSFIDKTNLVALFDNHNVSGMILYQELCDAMSVIEICEGRPANTPTLNVDKLDHKGMRIVNRLVNYLDTKNMAIEDIVSEKISC